MNKQEFEKQAEALYTDIRSFLDNAFELFYQIEKPQKAVVPKLVAEWLKEHLYVNTLLEVLNDAENEQIVPSAVNDWILDNQRDFVIAWHNGFEVEQEQLYTVEIPNPNLNTHTILQKKGKGLVLVTVTNARWKGWENSKLTESEIKEDFEWAWQFAVPMEVEAE
ncbi:DUF1642 domain-containing protein [Streptococcus suis]|uniref:DUF1642 domain-containing protein n=1 Tax=Streptococcus suis TaxID=1307 RepID=UPI000CF4A11C|nr:DUF1642 domain-containing protein [Streptococcus suis]